MTISPRPLADPHAREGTDIAGGLGVTPSLGLPSPEAATRLERDGPNEIAHEARSTWLTRIGEQFGDPLVSLLLLAIVVSAAAWALEGRDGLPVDAIVIAGIVVVNAGIGVVQSNRADSAAASLREMAATKARVIRDGQTQTLDARGVVAGDILVLAAGDSVPADGRLIDGQALEVAEAALTGESAAVTKSAEPVDAATVVGDRTSMVFAGTSVVAGHGRAIVVATGMRTEVGKIALLLRDTVRAKTPLEREIASIGRLLGLLVIGIAVVVVSTLFVVADLESTSDVIDVLLVGVSLAVAAVPEGLPAVLSVVLALGVQRMAGRNALVKRLASAETLGAATTICTDKTGTLTRGEMTVQAAFVASTRVDVSGVGYEPAGTLTVSDRPVDSPTSALVDELLAAAATASDATVSRVEGQWRTIGTPTEAALVVAAIKAGVDVDAIAARERIAELPFTSERKRMSVLVADVDANADVLFTKGAPDVLLPRCSHELTESGSSSLTDSRRGRWSRLADELAADGMRTIAIARRLGPTAPLHAEDELDLEWLGLVGITDPPRVEARESVATAQRSGIRVLMITGDHPETARKIASTLGITEPDGRVVTGAEIDRSDDAALVRIATEASVFARVAPAHKLRLVRALQEAGHIVAMTGDGVNDAPALKAADIGTSMGVAGTDVAREAADMILLDDNFATIVFAVAEGRTIFHNVRSFLRYLLSSNVGEVFTVFFGILLAGWIGPDSDGVLAPLTATQILWINLLTDTGPALALGVDPLDRRLMLLPPRDVRSGVIDRAMKRGILVIGATMAIVTLLMIDLKLPGGLIHGDASVGEARTAGFTVLVLAQLFNCFSARSDHVSARHGWRSNKLLFLSVAFALVLQVLVVHLPILNDAFATVPLSAGDWVLSAALASVVLWVSELRKWAERRFAGVG